MDIYGHIYIYIYITRHPGFGVIFGPWDRNPDSPIMGPGSSNFGSCLIDFWVPPGPPEMQKSAKSVVLQGPQNALRKKTPSKDTKSVILPLFTTL